MDLPRRHGKEHESDCVVLRAAHSGLKVTVWCPDESSAHRRRKRLSSMSRKTWKRKLGDNVSFDWPGRVPIRGARMSVWHSKERT